MPLAAAAAGENRGVVSTVFVVHVPMLNGTTSVTPLLYVPFAVKVCMSPTSFETGDGDTAIDVIA